MAAGISFNKIDTSPSIFIDFLSVSLSDDLADDLGDVDFEDPGNADDEGWETEDEMEAEAEQDDSELTFSKHTGSILPRVHALIIRQILTFKPFKLLFPSFVQARCFA